MIMEMEGSLNMPLYDFFIKGDTSFTEKFDKKPVTWISDLNWKDLLYLSETKEFSDLKHKFEENLDEWKAWFDHETPEDQ